ncbi:glycosyltransferase family 2 protein [Lacinutrix jangbogonensis]|uniref:glycosyltransferase family 2 protein n=1 Tax=Lacinutrix jangbogonensis TaxID=1469557 RepID=UPI00053F1CE6|nr:glycosyltransferase family A protein [Lacinutrix jangbogonensis]
MLILFHKNNRVVEVVDSVTNTLITFLDQEPTKVLFSLASKFPNRIIVWSHLAYKGCIDTMVVKSHFNSNNSMISNSNSTYFGDAIGYVEDTPFININKKVKFPTWLMHSDCGAIYGEVLLVFREQINFKNSFNYTLNSIAKLGITNGLFCYFSPDIVIGNNTNAIGNKASTSELFQFVKEHFKAKWVLLLFINLLIFEKKVALLSLVKSLFYNQKRLANNISYNTNKPSLNADVTLSVLIPTLGRAKYLQDVLKDLANQTLKPKEVIIIEQDDSESIKTELEYLNTKDWPFKIVHKLIPQTGACNARNIGLNLVTSDYVFLADDDIRFDENTIKSSLKFIKEYSHKAITLSCLRENDIEKVKVPIQWLSFGSGCSIVEVKAIKNVNFDMAFEHGFGEDSDFGMQLRNKGIDVIYAPLIRLKHLKAPIGGFRKPYIRQWEKQVQKPKPSPTVMFFKLKHQTVQQLRSYKITLFFKYYKNQAIKNPYKYYRQFKKNWKLSIYWAEQLKSLNN